MALRAAGLSNRSLTAITDMINGARTVDPGRNGHGGPPVGGPRRCLRRRQRVDDAGLGRVLTAETGRAGDRRRLRRTRVGPAAEHEHVLARPRQPGLPADDGLGRVLQVHRGDAGRRHRLCRHPVLQVPCDHEQSGMATVDVRPARRGQVRTGATPTVTETVRCLSLARDRARPESSRKVTGSLRRERTEPLRATSERPPGAAEEAETVALPGLQELAERMVNGRTFALGAISGAGVPVQLALAGRAAASTGSATEEALNRGSTSATRSRLAVGRSGHGATCSGSPRTRRASSSAPPPAARDRALS
jgi:hypothetical protein